MCLLCFFGPADRRVAASAVGTVAASSECMLGGPYLAAMAAPGLLAARPRERGR